MKRYNNYYYKIVDILIDIRIPYKIIIKKESENFIKKNEKYKDVLIQFKEIDFPIKVNGNIVFKDFVKIYKMRSKFIHEFCLNTKPYAWLIPIDKHRYEYKYLKGKEKYAKYSMNILKIINIEQILNKFDAFILHCSFIKYKNKAILFSAPSGTGKSTQADLWSKYENAEIINGDRAGLRKIDDKWLAYGLPFAGSSNIFKNKKAPISHIIVLRQGKENKLTRLSPREAFIKIYSETTVHTWDKEFQENIVNMITDLVQKIPVYQYECLPDKSAVDYLKKKIEEDINEAEISRA